MADDTTLSPGAGGDAIRDVDKSPGVKGKTQVVIIDMGGGGVEDITSVPATQATLAAVLTELLLKAKLTDTQPVSNTNLDVALSTRTKPSDQQHAIVDSGSITANAGSNLNTSLLALESGGNLASLAAKDFATQATLALVAKDATLTGGTAREQIYDPQFASSAMVDSLRGIRSHQMVRLFGDNFSDGLGIGKDAGTFPTSVTCVDTATWSVTSGVLVLRTGSANNGASATLESLKTADRISATLSGLQTGVKAPAPTTWKIVSRKDAVDTPVLSGSFNGTQNTPDNNFHRNEIFYQGPGSAKFIIDGVLLHSLSGQPSTPRTSTLDLPIRYELINDAVNTVARWGIFDTNNGYFYEAVYPVADITINIHGSTCLVFGPGPDAFGYDAPLPLNAAQETGGTLTTLVARTLDLTEIMVDIRTELRILNGNLCQGLNVRDENHLLRKDPFFIVN
jgi:hypothetical protein